MSEDDVRWFIANPRIMFCSDGELHGAHPRGAGSFPRLLGRYVREQRVLPLETAIHKMTLMSAEQLSLKDRGRIAQGYIADLVLFDPATVTDQSLRQPWQSAGRSRQPFLFELLIRTRKNGKKWVLLASLSGCIMRASFLGTGNNFSCVVFRKEKNREFPG